MAVLQLQKVSVSYGLLRVVNGVSLSLNTGDFLSVIGPNGAGKTTLISAISGLLPVTAGTIVYRHRDITKWKADQRARSGIGRSFQHTNLFPQLTAKENVLIAIGARRGVHIWQILGKKPPQMVGEAYSYLQQVGLDTHAESSAASLAHGDKRKLEFAMLLALEPTVLLLDEPTAGMSLAETKAIFDMIARLKASRKYTMILVEHKLDVVMKLSDRIAVLHQGELITEGEPAQVMSNPEVTQAYLGGHNGNTA